MRAIFCVIIGMALGWGTSSIARPGASHAATSFRIAILPDTQRYAQRYPETFDAQLAWIANMTVTAKTVFIGVTNFQSFPDPVFSAILRHGKITVRQHESPQRSLDGRKLQREE